MLDDRARYEIWLLMRGGMGYYKAFHQVFGAIYWVWLPTMSYLWALCSSVAQIKLLYFLCGSIIINIDFSYDTEVVWKHGVRLIIRSLCLRSFLVPHGSC